MTPAEFAEVVEWLEDRYPTTKAYRNAERIYPDFAYLPFEAFRAAAKQAYAGGAKTAPSFGELVDATRHNMGRFTDDTDPTLADCDRRGRHGALGILPDAMVAPLPGGRRDSLATPPETRVAICSDCRAEITRPASRLPTLDEIKAGEGTREAPPGMDRSDRIAR